MIPTVNDFLTNKFVLPRYSESVTPLSSGYRHLAGHTWEFANIQTPSSILRKNVDGTTETGLHSLTINNCLAEYVFQSQDPAWYSVAPWYIGSFEEINMWIRELPEGVWGYYALAAPTTDINERVSVSVQLFFVMPISSALPSTAQARKVNELVGFIYEAARFADATVTKIQDVPNFQRWLDAKRVMNEVLGVICQLNFVINYKTSRSYEVQV